MWATKRLQLILEDAIPLLGGSPNKQNFHVDHDQITPFIIRAEGLADHLHSGSTVKTTAYLLDNLLLLGNWWICRAFHAHANSLSHQTSPTHLHTHCISIKVSHNSAPQHTWSSNISMPDLPSSHFRGQHNCSTSAAFWPFHRYHEAFWKVYMESCQLHKLYNKLLMFLNVPTAFSPFFTRWCARL